MDTQTRLRTDADLYCALLNRLESDVWHVWAGCVGPDVEAPEPDDDQDKSQAQLMLEQIREYIHDLQSRRPSCA